MKLTIENLSFERNNQLLFSQLNFAVKTGELLQIKGANGSGKSTLLRILAGFIEPQSGTVRWQDRCIFAERDLYQNQLHYLGHQNGIKPYLTVYENLRLHCALTDNHFNSSKFQEVIKRMGLRNLIDTQIIHLSAGQARRVALARLLLTSAAIWILDEPVTALDSEGQDCFITLLNQHLSDAGIAIISTHQNLQTKSDLTIQLDEKVV